MSFCPKCGKEILQDAAYCVACGATVSNLDKPAGKNLQQVDTNSLTRTHAEVSTTTPTPIPIKNQGTQVTPKKSNKMYWLIVPSFILTGFVMRYVGGQIGKAVAVEEIQASVPSDGVPVNLFGTKFAMSKSEFLKIHPDAQEISPNKLLIFGNFYGRAVTVGFDFQDDMLIMIVVTFSVPSTISFYNETQTKLTGEFRDMSVPRPYKMYELFSTKRIDRYVMNHVFMKINGNPTEQLIIYRSKSN